MVNNWAEYSKEDTAVLQSTPVLLITEDERIVARVQEALQNESRLWGLFALQVRMTAAAVDETLPDAILLDWTLLQTGQVDTAVLPTDIPIIIIARSAYLHEIQITAYADICLLEEISATNLPWIIKKSIQQTILLQKERQQRAFAEALRDINSSLNETLDFDQLLDRILAQVGRVLPYDKANVMLVDGVKTTPVRMLGYENYPEVVDHQFNLTDVIAFTEIIKSKQPMLIPDVLEYPHWLNKIATTRSWLCAPILVDDKVGAFICLDKKEPNFYQQGHLEQITIFAKQVALAMEKVEIYSATQRQLDELSALHALALASAEARNEDDLIAKGTQIIDQALYPDNFGVLLLDSTKQMLITHVSYRWNGDPITHPIIPVTEGIVGYVARTGRPYSSADIRQDEYYLSASTQTRSEICVPLSYDEEIIGVINAESRELNAYSERDERLMLTLSNQLSMGIQRMRLFALEQQRRQQAETLREAAITLNTTLDVDTLLNRLLELASQFVSFDSANVMLANEHNHLEIKAIRGYAGRDINAVFSYLFEIADTPTFKHIYETKKPFLINDTFASSDWEILPEIAQVRSWLGVPLVVGNEVIGCYSLDKLEVNGFSDEDVRLVEALASQTAVSLQNIQLLQTTQLAVQESNILNTISQALNAAPNITENVPKLAQSLQELTNCQFMSLFLFAEDREYGEIIALDEPIVNKRQPRQLIKVSDTVSITNLLQGKIHFTPDIAQEMKGHAITQMLYKFGVRSRLNIPLVAGKVIVGSLNIGWSSTHGYQLRQVPVLTQIANAIAHALERSRLFDEIKRWTHYWTILHEFSRKITEEVEIEKLCQTAVSYLTQKLDYFAAAILIVNSNQTAVSLQAVAGENTEQLIIGEYQQQFGEGIIGLVAQDEQMIHAPNTNLHPNFLPSKRVVINSELAFPLRSGGKLLGVLDINSDVVNAFSEEDIAILTIVSDQLATALGKAILFMEKAKHTTEIEQRNQELIALNEVGKKLAATLDISDIHRVMYDEIVGKLLQASHYFVGHYDQAKDLIYCMCAIVDGQELAIDQMPPLMLDDGILHDIVQTRQAQMIDLQHSASILEADWYAAETGDEQKPQSAIYVPLVSGNRVLGIMFLQSYETDAFQASDLTLITTLANQASIAIENANLFVEMNQRTVELEALFNTSTALRIANGLEEMFTKVLQKALQITGGTVSSIYLVDQPTGDLVAYGNYPEDVELRIRREVSESNIIDYVISTEEIYIAYDLETDPIVSFLIEDAPILEAVCSSIHLPLRTKDFVVGILNIGLVEQREISEDEVRVLTAVSEIAGSAIQRTLIMDTLEQHVIDRTSELAFANERLKDLDRLKSKFVADVSHELRTPITNISLYLDLISQGDSSKQERYLAVLKHQTERLMNLIEDTLNLSRIELGKDKVTFHSFDLNEVARPVAMAHKLSAEAASLQFIADFANDLPPLYGERNQMAQVVANLLANAINYTSAGSIRLRTEWHPTEKEVWLVVADTGMGINPDDLPHLFDRFYRGREVSQSTIAGTGLGLAIVKEIVDVHAGKIDIESELGYGTTFIVKFPIYS